MSSSAGPMRVLVTPRSLQPREGRTHPALVPLVEAGWIVVYPGEPGPLPAPLMRHLVEGVHAAIIGLDHFDASVAEAARLLRIVARFGAGLDRVDVRACTERGIAVTCTPDANTLAVAEHTLALVLAVARHVVEHDIAVRAGRWQAREGIELCGRTLGVVGLGRIGTEVARRGVALGMRVVYHDVERKPQAEHELGVQYRELDDLLRESDVITLHAPYHPGSPPLLGRREISLLRPGTILVNTARGELVDEDALVRALYEGRLGGAALDVFQQEPLPPDHPLVRAPRVVLSPHAAARTQEAVARMAREAVASILEFFAGRRPRHVVNPAVFAREVAEAQGETSGRG